MKHGMSQLEVAKALGLSRVRVGQIERKALRKLKNSGKLDKFLGLLDAPISEYYGEEFVRVKQESGE
jgi:transcriptional regulator with XRE-family HTH domain